MEGGVGTQIHSGLTSEPLLLIFLAQEVSTSGGQVLRKPKVAGRGVCRRLTGTDSKGCSTLSASGNPPNEDREAWPSVMLLTDERAKERCRNQG